MVLIIDGRQVSDTLGGIREDHRARYNFAIGYARRNGIKTACDVGAGIGYGSWMLADSGLTVQSYEINRHAIEYGKQHYQHERLTRSMADIMAEPLSGDLLTAFEIVEHVPEPERFLTADCNHLVMSVPNENVIPFSDNRHHEHVRHYTPEDVIEMLIACKWRNVRLYYQAGKRGPESMIAAGKEGRTIIATAQR
jgi:hypothetical protein